jgi:hypothetical protein
LNLMSKSLKDMEVGDGQLIHESGIKDLCLAIEQDLKKMDYNTTKYIGEVYCEIKANKRNAGMTIDFDFSSCTLFVPSGDQDDYPDVLEFEYADPAFPKNMYEEMENCYG